MGLPPRTSARTALRAALAVCVLGALPACTDADKGGNGDGGEPSPQPTPHVTTAADICTGLVAYWVKEALNGSKWAGLDWEQKGLSNEQLAVHDEVLAAARAKERAEGRPAALTFADRESRRRCAAANGATGSSDNWRPPSGTASPTALTPTPITPTPTHPS